MNWPLLLWGEAGAGKTCAGLCLLDFFGGVYVDAGLFAAVRAAAMRGEASYLSGYPMTDQEIWRTLGDAHFLVLDELGSRERVSDHQYESVKRAMDIFEQRPAVYISNLSPTDIARVYDDRIASRATAGTIIEMTGDMRRR